MDWLLSTPWIGGVIVVVLGLVGFLLFRARAPGPPSLPGPQEPTHPSISPPPVNRFLAALERTRESLGASFRAVFGQTQIDETTWTNLEEALLRADVGAKATMRLIADLRKRVPATAPAEALRGELRALIEEKLVSVAAPLIEQGGPPLVILMVGVNGSGKTTTIGKLAARFKLAERSVILGAGDTFRAGAIEQLKVWGERSQVPVVAHQEGADPAAVCHDTIQAAKSRSIDVVICDTAGRLQAHKALMDELAKVRRVIQKVLPGAPHEVLLVIDATMGQNALNQARIFKDVAGVTGVVLTKLDGTAKGGVVIAIAEELGLPVKLVGLGEKIDDLRPFEPKSFVEALF